MPSNVLIAAPEHLPALKDRPDLGETVAFSDSEALRALDVITRQRPAIVALERLFAATSRGAALINRIKADPTLSACEIRIVSHDDPQVVVSAAAPSSEAASTRTAIADEQRSNSEPIPEAPIEAPAVPRWGPTEEGLDRSGTRRVQRVRIVDGIEILVDGNPAILVDLSPMGAQVMSPTIVRPNQRLRVSLPDPAKPIRLSAGVVWASFEMPKAGPRYRAGLEFFDGDGGAIIRFCEENKQ